MIKLSADHFVVKGGHYGKPWEKAQIAAGVFDRIYKISELHVNPV